MKSQVKGHTTHPQSSIHCQSLTQYFLIPVTNAASLQEATPPMETDRRQSTPSLTFPLLSPSSAITAAPTQAETPHSRSVYPHGRGILNPTNTPNSTSFPQHQKNFGKKRNLTKPPLSPTSLTTLFLRWIFLSDGGIGNPVFAGGISIHLNHDPNNPVTLPLLNLSFPNSAPVHPLPNPSVFDRGKLSLLLLFGLCCPQPFNSFDSGVAILISLIRKSERGADRSWWNWAKSRKTFKDQPFRWVAARKRMKRVAFGPLDKDLVVGKYPFNCNASSCWPLSSRGSVFLKIRSFGGIAGQFLCVENRFDEPYGTALIGLLFMAAYRLFSTREWGTFAKSNNGLHLIIYLKEKYKLNNVEFFKSIAFIINFGQQKPWWFAKNIVHFIGFVIYVSLYL